MKISPELLEKIFKAIIAVLGIFLGYNQYQEHEEHQQLKDAVYNLAIAFENIDVPVDSQTDDEYVVNL